MKKGDLTMGKNYDIYVGYNKVGSIHENDGMPPVRYRTAEDAMLEKIQKWREEREEREKEQKEYENKQKAIDLMSQKSPEDKKRYDELLNLAKESSQKDYCMSKKQFGFHNILSRVLNYTWIPFAIAFIIFAGFFGGIADLIIEKLELNIDTYTCASISLILLAIAIILKIIVSIYCHFIYKKYEPMRSELQKKKANYKNEATQLLSKYLNHILYHRPL